MKTYEQKFDELKRMNEKLSSPDLPLAEMVEIYEKAQILMNELRDELEKSKLVVENITKSMKEEK
ncbi:MAG: exodeoxyribonuclease VII small subunit [Bacillota bacterium]|nr:exodeoxyribonuclease VII small subunit [Bacillota bacterium]